MLESTSSTTWEQNAAMIIAHYLIIQEFTAPEGEQLMKWLSGLKMATEEWGTFILLALVPVLSAKSRVPRKVSEAVRDGQGCPHPDGCSECCMGCWGFWESRLILGFLVAQKQLNFWAATENEGGFAGPGYAGRHLMLAFRAAWVTFCIQGFACAE